MQCTDVYNIIKESLKKKLCSFQFEIFEKRNGNKIADIIYPIEIQKLQTKKFYDETVPPYFEFDLVVEKVEDS